MHSVRTFGASNLVPRVVVVFVLVLCECDIHIYNKSFIIFTVKCDC